MRIITEISSKAGADEEDARDDEIIRAFFHLWFLCVRGNGKVFFCVVGDADDEYI